MATYETLASPWQHVLHPLGGSAVTPAKKSDAGRSSPSPPTTLPALAGSAMPSVSPAASTGGAKPQEKGQKPAALPSAAAGRRTKGTGTKPGTNKKGTGDTKIGRPKKDNCTQLREGLADLRSSVESTKKFFGPEWKNVMRNWDGYIKGVEKLCEEEEQQEALASMEQLLKQASAARRVLTVVERKGLADQATLKAYEEEMAWLARDPLAPTPFPPFMHRMLQEESIANAWLGTAFSAALADSTLSEIIAVDQIGGRQTALFFDKVMLITLDTKISDARSNMQELCLAFGDPFDSRRFASVPFKAEVNKLTTLAFSPHWPRDATRQVRRDTLQEVMDSLPSSPLGEALESSKKGRDLVAQCDQHLLLLAAEIKQVKGLGATWQRFVSEPEALQDLEKEATTMDLALVQEVVVPEELNKHFDKCVRRFFQALFRPTDEPSINLHDVGRELWVGENASVLHMLPDVMPDACTQYSELRQALEKHRDWLALPDEWSDHDLAVKWFSWLCTGASDAWRESCVYKQLERVLSASDADVAVQRFTGETLGAKGVACKVVALKVAAICCDSAKAAAAATFEGACTFNFEDPVVLKRLAGFKLDGDVAATLGCLRRWNPNSLMSKELQFIQKLGTALSCCARRSLFLLDHPTRSERKITEEGVKEIIALRGHLKDLNSFLSTHKVVPLFALQPSAADAHMTLGPVLSLTGLEQTMKQMNEVVATFVQLWISDISELSKLVSSYVVPLSPADKDDIMQERCAALLQQCLTSDALSKCAKGAALLATWQALIRRVNGDGHGVVATPEQMKEWRTVQDSCVECADFMADCRKYVHEIPRIVNRAKRIATTKESAAKAKNLGKDLLKQVELLTKGESAVAPE